MAVAAMKMVLTVRAQLMAIKVILIVVDGRSNPPDEVAELLRLEVRLRLLTVL